MLESFFNKAAGLQACSFIKKRLQHRSFPANISKILITAFFINTSGGCFWQLLYGQLYFCLNKDHVVVVFFFNPFSTKLGRSNITNLEIDSFEASFSLSYRMFE